MKRRRLRRDPGPTAPDEGSRMTSREGSKPDGRDARPTLAAARFTRARSRECGTRECK